MPWLPLGTLTPLRDWQSLPPILLPARPQAPLTLRILSSLTSPTQTADYALFRLLRIDRLYSSHTYEIYPTPDPQSLPITIPQEPAEVWQWNPQLALVKRTSTYTAPWSLTLHLHTEGLDLLLR